MKANLRREGNGPTLVLVHGLGGNLHSWDGVIHNLAGSFDILRYDLRGHGHSPNPPSPWSLDDFVDDLESVLTDQQVSSALFAGFSLGGLICQSFALRHPARVIRLVILSAVAGRTEPERARVEERVRNLESGRLDVNIELAMERWFSPAFRRDHPERVQARIDTLKANDPDGYLNAYRVFALGDLGDELQGIHCPTLVVTGEDDPGSSPRMAQFMHDRIEGSELEILPGLRHSLLVEAPEAVAQRLDRFFGT